MPRLLFSISALSNSFATLSCILIISCNSTTNKDCSDQKKPYYSVNLHSSQDFYEIKNLFKENILPTNSYSGIVKIDFDISCVGDIENIEVTSMSLEYKSTPISNDLTNQVKSAMQNLKAYNAPITRDGEPITIHKFYTLRFENGVLTQVLPK